MSEKDCGVIVSCPLFSSLVRSPVVREQCGFDSLACLLWFAVRVQFLLLVLQFNAVQQNKQSSSSPSPREISSYHLLSSF